MTMRDLSLAVFASFILLCGPALAADLSGNWVATIPAERGPQYARVSLNDANGALTGAWGDFKIAGTAKGAGIALTLSDAAGKPAGALTGTLKGEAVSGTGSILMPAAGPAGPVANPAPVSFTLARTVAAPAKPRDLHFDPTNFFGYYAASNKPALTIFPGDIVHTWTADAGGVDAKGIQHRGGDSNIGPFYVEGALPGDTLVVHLLKLRTNRATARQGTRLNANAATTPYLVGAQYDNSVDGAWTILPDKGIAVPTHPGPHMKNYSIPLKPMLGCISVAPPGDQQYKGGDLGPYGGNMDYNDNAEGTTLYFPVFHPGALLGMGDGHAAMGDGEVVGSGLETSMDVDFSVEIIRGNATSQVRAETGDYLIAFGVAGSVPDSIQVATSELAKWIKATYKLNDNEVAILFAATLKYDITELVDSRFNVAAKVPKTVLAAMK
jgi:amidase